MIVIPDRCYFSRRGAPRPTRSIFISFRGRHSGTAGKYIHPRGIENTLLYSCVSNLSVALAKLSIFRSRIREERKREIAMAIGKRAANRSCIREEKRKRRKEERERGRETNGRQGREKEKKRYVFRYTYV